MKLTEQQIASDYDKDLGKITTASQEAYRFYKEGRDLFGKQLFLESIPLLEKAISIDPDFAMAYRSIGSAYHNIDLARGGRENQEKGNEYLRISTYPLAQIVSTKALALPISYIESQGPYTHQPRP